MLPSDLLPDFDLVITWPLPRASCTGFRSRHGSVSENVSWCIIMWIVQHHSQSPIYWRRSCRSLDVNTCDRLLQELCDAKDPHTPRTPGCLLRWTRCLECTAASRQVIVYSYNLQEGTEDPSFPNSLYGQSTSFNYSFFAQLWRAAALSS